MPGFNFEDCQLFTGETLSKVMEKIDFLAPKSNP